ncbi:hypothetical protein QHF83_10035 [Polyangium sp. 15x6]|nr:hypothetical protein [Polyangium sp. 15x6]
MPSGGVQGAAWAVIVSGREQVPSEGPQEHGPHFFGGMTRSVYQTNCSTGALSGQSGALPSFGPIQTRTG